MGRFLLAGLLSAAACCSVSFASDSYEAEAMRTVVSLNQRVALLGYDSALATAPKLDLSQLSQEREPKPPGGLRLELDCWGLPGVCAPSAGRSPYEIRNDGIQILTNEVLFQTLRYFGVKFIFEKKGGEWVFTVVNPIEGENFQDLDTPLVLGALTEFRRYLIGLLCNNPNPTNVLALMNRYDLGQRFRWDMAWALLGNELPETPNRYMRYSDQWKRFAGALDAIQGGHHLDIFNPGGLLGGRVGPAAAASPRVGNYAREAIGVIQLVGTIASTLVDMYCRIDLTVDPARQRDEQQVVLKLLQLKKDLYHRFNELRPALDEMGKQGTKSLGRPISFYPPGKFPKAR